MCACMHVCVYMCVCMHVCVYISCTSLSVFRRDLESIMSNILKRA